MSRARGDSQSLPPHHLPVLGRVPQLHPPSFFPSAALGGLQHGEHFRLEIFEGCNFTGQCLELVDDCPFLPSRGWAQTCVNAVKVYGDGA